MTNQNHNFYHYILTIFSVTVRSLIKVVMWVILGFAGYLIYSTKRTPFDLVIGLPLILGSAGMTINSLTDSVRVIFSTNANKSECNICNKPTVE